MSQESNHSHHKQVDLSRFESLINSSKRLISNHFKNVNDQDIIIISIAEQRLYLTNNNDTLINSFIISSAEAGTGNLSGSFQTPIGLHQISEKFGENAEVASIFKSRKNTLNIAKTLSQPNAKSGEDNITSRILWLDGLEQGINKGNDEDGNNVDSHSRYIYIHGTDEEGRLGKVASHGCIRMANQEVIELFDIVKIGCLVVILEE